MSQRVKTDASLDVRLNPVQLPNGTIVPWGVAFPQRDLNFRTTPRDD